MLRYLQILNWILLAASGVIALVLAVVCLLFWIYRDEPQIAASFERLQHDTVLFAGLTALAAAAALTLRKTGRWRWFWQCALLAGLGGAVWYYLQPALG